MFSINYLIDEKILLSTNNDCCLNITHDYDTRSEAEIRNSPTSDGLLCNIACNNSLDIPAMHAFPKYHTNDRPFPQNLKYTSSNHLNPNARSFTPNSKINSGIDMVTVNTLDPNAQCFFSNLFQR